MMLPTLNIFLSLKLFEKKSFSVGKQVFWIANTEIDLSFRFQLCPWMVALLPRYTIDRKKNFNDDENKKSFELGM